MSNKPLADRMRPEFLHQYVGQKHILGEGKLLRRIIEADQLKSLILYGHPGTGKSSLANVISKMTDCRFVQLNATKAKKSDLEDIFKMAEDMYNGQGRRTILFLDEIHRFTKAQQDTLLPPVEDGTIILIGATTENPHFSVIGALLSRSRIFKLESLTPYEIETALIVAIDRMYDDVSFDIKAIKHIANIANGDLRTAYNALELAILTTIPSVKSVDGNKLLRVITLEIAQESIQAPVIKYDENTYYDIMSAFSKSLRGSDSDAALHYFYRMIEAGEDPNVILRRLITHAAEDVGMANPQALPMATAALQAYQVTGMPEARFAIATAIIYLCESPKSNSVAIAIAKAKHDVQNKPLGDVPLALRDTHSKGAKEFRNGEGYIYTHNIPGGWTPNQQYLPDNLVGTKYYQPTSNGYEMRVKQMRKERQDNYDSLIGGK